MQQYTGVYVYLSHRWHLSGNSEIIWVANFWISDCTTNYQMSKNGLIPSKHVRLREIFHKEDYLSLEKVIPMDKFANHYKMVF